MSESQQAARRDVNLKRLLKESGSKGFIDISNFLTSPYVINNPQQLNYATSLRVLLPNYETVTPTVLDNINIVGLDENGKPNRIYDTLDLDDATLVGDDEYIEVNDGDVVVWAELPEKDDPTTPTVNEKSTWQKIGSFIADGAKTIYNTGKDAAVWTWNNGGQEIAKIGIMQGIDYLIGGNAEVEGKTDEQLLLEGNSAPLLQIPVSSNAGLIEYIPENNKRDVTNGDPVKINPDFLYYVSSNLVKLPENFASNLRSKKMDLEKN